MNMKKMLSLALAGVMALSLMACSAPAPLKMAAILPRIPPRPAAASPVRKPRTTKPLSL